VDDILMLLRWFHFLFGVTWIGLLYYFNFVQTPFFGETEAPVRLGAQQKLLPRALWWFRWGAMGTVIAGLAYLLIWWSRLGWAFNSWAVAIVTGGTMGIIMWANVWFVIWPKQKVVIANAVAMGGGAAANPAAAPAGRRAAIASRTNTLFSIPMLFFMGAASHYPVIAPNITTGGIWLWIIIVGGLIGLIEINALVGTQGATKKPLDSINGVIWAGFIVWLVLTGIIMALFR
jgi:uncharacterized membrane protein